MNEPLPCHLVIAPAPPQLEGPFGCALLIFPNDEYDHPHHGVMTVRLGKSGGRTIWIGNVTQFSKHGSPIVIPLPILTKDQNFQVEIVSSDAAARPSRKSWPFAYTLPSGLESDTAEAEASEIAGCIGLMGDAVCSISVQGAQMTGQTAIQALNRRTAGQAKTALACRFAADQTGQINRANPVFTLREIGPEKIQFLMQPVKTDDKPKFHLRLEKTYDIDPDVLSTIECFHLAPAEETIDPAGQKLWMHENRDGAFLKEWLVGVESRILTHEDGETVIEFLPNADDYPDQVFFFVAPAWCEIRWSSDEDARVRHPSADSRSEANNDTSIMCSSIHETEWFGDEVSVLPVWVDADGKVLEQTAERKAISAEGTEESAHLRVSPLKVALMKLNRAPDEIRRLVDYKAPVSDRVKGIHARLSNMFKERIRRLAFGFSAEYPENSGESTDQAQTAFFWGLLAYARVAQIAACGAWSNSAHDLLRALNQGTDAEWFHALCSPRLNQPVLWRLPKLTPGNLVTQILLDMTPEHREMADYIEAVEDPEALLETALLEGKLDTGPAIRRGSSSAQYGDAEAPVSLQPAAGALLSNLHDRTDLADHERTQAQQRIIQSLSWLRDALDNERALNGMKLPAPTQASQAGAEISSRDSQLAQMVLRVIDTAGSDVDREIVGAVGGTLAAELDEVVANIGRGLLVAYEPMSADLEPHVAELANLVAAQLLAGPRNLKTRQRKTIDYLQRESDRPPAPFADIKKGVSETLLDALNTLQGKLIESEYSRQQLWHSDREGRLELDRYAEALTLQIIVETLNREFTDVVSGNTAFSGAESTLEQARMALRALYNFPSTLGMDWERLWLLRNNTVAHAS